MTGRALPLLTALALGCPSAPDVVYELPAGYRGVFVVTVDHEVAGLPFASGSYHVLVPPAGLLSVRDDAPLEGWHQSRATFADGTTI